MLTATFIAVISAFTLLPNPPDLVEIIFGLEKGKLSIIPAVFLWTLIFLAALFAQGLLFHIVARLLHGQGSYSGIVCGLCFALFPLVFFAPLALLRALMVSAVGNSLYSAVSLVLFLWIIYLTITSIRENYRFSLEKSVATCFIPVIVLIIIPLLLLIIFTAL